MQNPDQMLTTVERQIKRTQTVTVPASRFLLSKEMEELGEIWRRTMNKSLSWKSWEGSSQERLPLRAPILLVVGTELPVPFQLRDGSGRVVFRKLLALCVTELGAARCLCQIAETPVSDTESLQCSCAAAAPDEPLPRGLPPAAQRRVPDAGGPGDGPGSHR